MSRGTANLKSLLLVAIFSTSFPAWAFDTGLDPAYSISGRPYGKRADAIGEGITPGDERKYDYERDKKERQEDDRFRSILYPALTTGLAWDDNIFRQDGDEKSATIFNLRPSISAQTAYRSNRFYGGYKGNYAWYSESGGQLDYDNHIFNLGADHTGKKTFFGAYAEYFRGNDQPGGVDNNADLFDEWDQYTARAWFQYGTDTARLNARLDAEWTDRQHDQDKSLDTETRALAGQLKARLTGKTRAVLEGGVQYFDYDHTNQDADRYYVRIGLNWDATSRTQGILTWGYEDFDAQNSDEAVTTTSDDPVFGNNEDNNGSTWKASIRWEPRERDTVWLNGSRGSRVSNGVGSNKVSTRGDVTWTHIWNSRIRSHLGVAVGEDDYKGADRNDDLSEITLNGTYQWRRNLLLTGGWLHEERDSNVDEQSYKRNLLELNVTWEY